MPVNEIYFLVQRPVEQRDYERFGVSRLRNKGIKAGFIDMTSLLNPEIKHERRGFDCPIFYVGKKADLLTFFENNDANNMLIIDLIGRRDMIPIYQIFSEQNVGFASFCANSIPSSPGISVRSMFSPGRIAGYIRNKFNNAGVQLAHPRYILAGGRKYINKYPPAGKNIRIIWAHTLDYDLYLDYKSRSPEPAEKGEYAVFLDEYFPLHPDFFVSGIGKNPYSDYRQYYLEINLMFKQIEAVSGLKVVIAAHPRAQYASLPDVFEGRKLIKGNTVNLVANAKLVLAHASTSLNFAVLFNKPVVFLAPEKVRGGYYGILIRSFARNMGKKPYLLAELETIDIENEMVLDPVAYEAYRENYIKTIGSQDKHFWDIVAEAI